MRLLKGESGGLGITVRVWLVVELGVLFWLVDSGVFFGTAEERTGVRGEAEEEADEGGRGMLPRDADEVIDVLTVFAGLAGLPWRGESDGD